MQEILTLKLTEREIKKILFDYYKINEQNSKVEFEIEIGTRFKQKEAIFKIIQTKKLNSLDVESQTILTQDDISKIVNFELQDKDYKVDTVNYEFDYNSSNSLILDHMVLNLMRNKKVKTKKRGWKKNV